MEIVKNNVFPASCISFISFILNIAVFVIIYNRLATPFLTEEQRVINAEFIMSVTAGAFATVAILTGIATYMVLRMHIPPQVDHPFSFLMITLPRYR